MQKKLSRIRIGKLFGVLKSPDLGRYLENLLGKFWACGLRCLKPGLSYVCVSLFCEGSQTRLAGGAGQVECWSWRPEGFGSWCQPSPVHSGRLGSQVEGHGREIQRTVSAGLSFFPHWLIDWLNELIGCNSNYWVIQGSHASWKVLDFFSWKSLWSCKLKLKVLKVLENILESHALLY